MPKRKFKLEVASARGDSAYLYLPDHPGSGKAGVVAKQLRLKELYPDYAGADVYFDLDKDDRLIGIEILC